MCWPDPCVLTAGIPAPSPPSPPVPAGGDGLDLLDDKALQARPFVAGQNSTHDILDLARPAASLRYRWLVAGDLKLIVSSGLKTGTTQHGSADAIEPPRLFDLKADPYEIKNLAADPAYADLRKKLEAEYDKQAKAIDFKIPDHADKPTADGEQASKKKAGKKKAK